MKELTKEEQLIAEKIIVNYLPGSSENHDAIIEIDDFIDLWEDEELPRLADIECVMKKLGFKEEECRIDFGFYVVNPEKEAE